MPIERPASAYAVAMGKLAISNDPIWFGTCVYLVENRSMTMQSHEQLRPSPRYTLCALHHLLMNATPIQLSSGRRDRLIRVTMASQERFSCCGYFRSKQCITPRAPPEKLHRLYKITPSRSDEMAKNDRVIRT
jgi:hypothetical protein